MDRRRAVALILGLMICLGLLGRWAWRPDERAPALDDEPPPTVAQNPPAATHSLHVVPRDSEKTGITTYDAPIAGGVFRGRVIDAVTREPVREFTVQAAASRFPSSSPRPPKPQSFQTKDGRFEYAGLPEGTWTIFTTARGYQRFELPDVNVPSKATREIVMPMRAGHALRGRVFDEITNEGIASATISFREAHVDRYEGNFRMRPSTTSRADGSFVLDGVAPGPVRITASAQKYAPSEIDIFVSGKAAPLEIALSQGGAVVGYLAGADGLTPVAGQVSLANLDENNSSTVASGTAGEFAYTHLPAGRYRLRGRSARLSGEREITLSHNERLEGIVLPLSAGRAIRGAVSGLRPEERQRTLVSIFDGRELHPIESRLDEQGAYELVGVPPGRTRVVANVLGRRNITTTVVMPADGDLTVNIEFKPGSRLTGRVTRGGKPAAGVSLVPNSLSATAERELYLYDAITNATGDYAIEDVPDGEYSFTIGAYVSPSVRVSGDTVFDIDIPAAQLSGRLLDDGTDAPVVGAFVRVLPAQPGAIRPGGGSTSDHFGNFAVRGLQAGDYMLSAYKPGYELYRAPLAYGSTISDMTIRMRPARGAELRVRDAVNGHAVSQVQVLEMLNGWPGVVLHLSLDQSGVSYLPTGLAGSALRISANGYAPVDIPSWNGQQLDLSMQRWRSQ